MKLYYICFTFLALNILQAGETRVINDTLKTKNHTSDLAVETEVNNISKLNSLYGDFVEQATQLNLLIEALAGLISQTNLVEPSQRSDALDWLQNARRLNESLLKSKLPQLSPETLTPVIIQLTLLVSFIEKAAQSKFAQRPYLQLDLPQKTQNISLEKLEKILLHSQISLNKISFIAKSNGLSQFNLAYRNISKVLNDYKIPTLMAVAGAGVAISSVFFLLLEEEQLPNEQLKAAHRKMSKFTRRFDNVTPLLSAAGKAFAVIAELGALKGLKTIFKKVDNKLRGEEILNKHTTHEYVADISLDAPSFDYIRPLLSPFYRIAEFLENPAQFAFTGLKNCQAILLVAPPGYGKSYIARAAAGLFNKSAGRTAFISVSTIDLFRQMQQDNDAISGIIEEARENAPCVLFFDEFHLHSPQIEKNPYILESMLKALDALNQTADPDKMVFVIAATNRPDLLDSALLRHGRFSQIITIPKPTLQNRISILEALCKQSAIDPDQIDIAYIAHITPGASPSTLNALFEHANFLAKRENRCLETSHLYEAINNIIRNIQPHTPYTEKERTRIATQIAGEAIYYLVTDSIEQIDAITIRPIKKEIQEKYDWMTKMPNEQNTPFAQKAGSIFFKTEPHESLTRQEISGLVAQNMAIKIKNGSELTPEVLTNRSIIFASLMEYQAQGLPLDTLSKQHQEEIRVQAYNELNKIEQEVERLLKTNEPLLTTLAQELAKREFLQTKEIIAITKKS